jgi:hypothetical protein
VRTVTYQEESEGKKLPFCDERYTGVKIEVVMESEKRDCGLGEVAISEVKGEEEREREKKRNMDRVEQ